MQFGAKFSYYISRSHQIFTFQDFIFYKRGIYTRANKHWNRRVGSHQVKLIGWGVENDGTEFWIGANSWGTVRPKIGFTNLILY